MTIIVYRDGIMAADGGTWQGDVVVHSTAQKLIRLIDGRVIGCAGSRPDIEAYILWMQSGSSPAHKPPCDHLAERDFGAIVAYPGGLFDKVDYKFRSYAGIGPWAVEGCHTEFAHGALVMGASADYAVRLAVKHCAYATGDVQIERVG